MSESLVDVSDVEETVTQVLTQLVQDGGDVAQMSVECIRSEALVGYDLFYYKDKGTKELTHMIDLEEYGVTKKWVIITEISKEVENNSIGRLNAYARQYVSRSVRGWESGTRPGNGGDGVSIKNTETVSFRTCSLSIVRS